MADQFNQVFGAFVGAADAMMALQARGTAQRDSNLRAQVALQGMRHEEMLLPLKMRLIEEQIATAGLERFGNLVDYGLKLKLQADQSAADVAAGSYFGGLMEEYSAWRAGGAGTDDSGASFSAPADAGGLPYDAGGGGVDDPVQGGFGDLEMPGGEGDGAAEMLLPGGDAAPGDLMPVGLVEGEGDGPEPETIADREMARRRAAAGGMSGIAAREMERRARGSVAYGGGGIGGLSEPIPEPGSVRMLRKIDRAIQMHGGPASMARRHPARLAQLIEMKAALEGDREALRWREAEQMRVKSDAERRTAAGKIVSAGLPVEAFADVLSAMQAGLPVDGTALDARIAAMREETAERRKRGAGEFYQLPSSVQERADVLRKEFQALAEVKNAKVVGNYLNSLEALAADQTKREEEKKLPTAANDISMVFAYMKILDPTSVVREAEFNNAAKAGGLPDQFQVMYNRIQSGQLFTPEMRKNMLESARLAAGPHQMQVQEATRFHDAILQTMVSDPEQLNVLRANVFGIAPEKVKAATQPASGSKAFATEAEMDAAGERGELKDGDPVTVGGRRALYRPKK